MYGSSLLLSCVFDLCQRPFQVSSKVSLGLEPNTAKLSCFPYTPSEAIALVSPEDCLLSLVSPHSNVYFC